MIKRYALLLVLGLAIVAGKPGVASAQYSHWELGVHGGVLWVDLFEQNTTMPVVGARVLKHFDNGWGIGPFFDYAWDNDVLVYHSYPLTDVDIYMYGLEADYTFPSPGPAYFFAKLGAGAATVELDTIPFGRPAERLFLRESQTRFMLAPGIGFKILNSRTDPFLAFRIDLEDRIIFNFPKRFAAHDTESEEEGITGKVNREEIVNNLMLTGGLSFLLGGAPRPMDLVVPLACPPTPICPAPEVPQQLCVEELWWYRTDSTITVLGQNWVKFGTATTMDRNDLVQVSELDGIPIYARVDDEFPYDRLWVPLCVPPNGFQEYVPEIEIRGTTG
jgi:outer membrane protein with beta-barrel domain